MSPTPQPSPLSRITADFRRRWLRALLVVGLARLLFIAAVLFAIGAGADWIFHIGWGWRLLPLLVFLAILGTLFWFSIQKPARHRWSDKQILAWLDSLDPEQAAMLLDRYELASAEGIEEKNDPRGQHLLEQARAALPAEPDTRSLINASFDRRATRTWWMAAGGAMMALVALAIVLPMHAEVAAVRFFNPFSTARWPHRTNIALTQPPGGWSVPQGEPLELHATVSGVEIPQELSLVYRVSGGHWVREHLPVANNAAQYKLAEVREPLEFYLSGGDDTTDTVKVEVIRRPSLEKVTAHIVSPPYAGIPERSTEGGDIEGLEGARAHIDFVSSTSIKSALLAFDGETEQSLPITNGRSFSTDFMLTKSTAYTVTLIGESGFREARPEHFDVRVRPDMPPEATIIAPEDDIEATVNANYKVQFTASDDFELAKVEFLYRLDNGPLQALSDRITGPVAVHGKKSGATFDWSLAALNPPAKDTVNLEYFVRATDTNPTGRGVTESSHRHIRILKPSLYRESLLLAARSLLDEALLAEKNQRLAYESGKKYLASGTGDENDPTWTDMVNQQMQSIDATRSMSGQLATLLQRAADNRLQTEFMSARLTQIAEVLRPVIDTQHAGIAKNISDATPRTAAESTPAALKAKRTQLLRQMSDSESGQKRAALELQRALFLVFDWNDLQSTAVAALRLYEQQDDCSRQTNDVAPKFIGRDIKDLSDKEQDLLVNLGRAQRVIYDAETVLEGRLQEILTKAERQKRQSIRVPIYTAYSDLRNNRVNDRLLHASDAIANNQAPDILNDQKAALEALRVVKAGLEAAGLPEKLAAIALSSPVQDVDQEDKNKHTDVEESAPPPPLVIADKQGSDPLTTALLSAGDALKDVVRRSKYLDEHDISHDLPRFQRLRLSRLHELSVGADQTMDQAHAAAEKANEAFIPGAVQNLSIDATAITQLISEKQTGGAVQQLGTDTAVGLTDLVQMLASERAVKQMKDEHDQQGGVDPFKRPYVLQADDLAKTTTAVVGMLEMRVGLLDASRAVKRVAPATQKSTLTLDQARDARRKRLDADQKSIATQWQAIKKQLEGVSDANKKKIATALGELATSDLTGKPQDEDVQRLVQAIQGLRDLMDARGELAPVVSTDNTPPPQEVAHMTQEQYDKLMSLESLKDRVAKDTHLPPALRTSLTASLSGTFPPDQQKFLAAYVNAILSAAQEGKQ